jgi:23S rRNA (guanosine2251-2'-O)-methyltransferase
VVNLARALDELAALGCWRVALDAEATATLDDMPERSPILVEGSGRRRLVGERCDFPVRLPIASQMATS